jgi:hypothetical protein
MTKKIPILVVAVLVCSLVLAGGVLAATGFAIPRSVIGGGGQQVTGGGYILNGTVGEPIASDLTGGHTGPGLSSGFWWPPGYEVYLPLVLKN